MYLRKIVEKIHIFIVETIWMRIYGFGGNHEAENQPIVWPCERKFDHLKNILQSRLVDWLVFVFGGEILEKKVLKTVKMQ